MPTLQALGHTLHYLDTGAPLAAAAAPPDASSRPAASAPPGPAPVVAFHSGGLSSRQWGKLAQAFAPRHRFLAPDFLSCGGSSPWVEREGGPAYHYSIEVDLACALLDSLGGPVHLVGHSFGGLVALRAALRSPGRVLSLGLFEPVAFGLLAEEDGSVERESRRQLSALDGAEAGSEAWLQRFIDWWQGEGAWSQLPAPAKAQFLAVGRKLSLEVTTLRADRLTRQELRPLAAPALILRSERSPEAARHTCALLAEALPSGRLVQLDGAGHLAPVTHAEQVNGLLLAHVAQVESARR
jgi:pimeloyl-ACP methyl ester carboxylesterase